MYHIFLFHLKIKCILLNEDHLMTSGEHVTLVYSGQSRGSIPKNVTHVIVDQSVKVIESSAFYGCAQLMRVELNDGLEKIKKGAFANTSLTRISIPSSVKVIGSTAFFGCSRLTNVELCEGLEKIMIRAFEECASLEDVSIPSTVNKIGRNAFGSCRSLKHISIPSTVKVIDSRAFWGCASLKSVGLFEGLEKIGDRAFEFCRRLEHIYIPSTVNVISSGVFNYCAAVNIQFYSGIEELVSSSTLRDWWTNLHRNERLSISILLACNRVPERLSMIQVTSWVSNIHAFLKSTSAANLRQFEEIDSRLTSYGLQQNHLHLLLNRCIAEAGLKYHILSIL